MSVTKILQCGALLACGLAVLLIAWMVRAGVPFALATLIALSIGPLIQSSLLGTQFLAGAIIDRRPGPRLKVLDALRLWLTESWTWWRMFVWHLPFRCHFPEPALVRDPERRAVLLIHGYMNNRAVWKPLLRSRALDACNVATLNLAPAFGSIDDYADGIHQAITALQSASGARQVHLVGHSMGGLAARAYLRRYGPSKIARIITLATPHQGTVFARFGIGVNTKQMRRESAYLKQLSLDTAPYADHMVCVGSMDDNLIVPRASVWLAGAQRIELECEGHLGMLSSQHVHRLLNEQCSAPPAQQHARSET